ncbi:hypothetical protein [Profundibacter sp.]|uniref:hypothetical protein n=1 Tax=Profundibacter sp. TaxID=3101071 RepID=UPI003D0CABCB
MTTITTTRPPTYFPLETGITAVALILFPLFFVSAQLLHPDPFATGIPKTGMEYAIHINGAHWMHIAHLLEFFCAPLLLVLALHFYARLKPDLPRLAFTALVMATIGTFMLAGNKAALCLTASAFDTLSDADLFAMAPGLEVLIHRRALMAVLWGIPLLPLGFALFATGLLKAGVTPKWQAAFILAGSLLLANPEIQAINTVASLFFAIGFPSYAWTYFHSQTSVA